MQHLDEGTLQAWLDGARSGLDPSRLASIERHLAACDACSSRADALARASFRAHALLSLGRDEYAPRVPYEEVARRARGSRTRERSRMRRVTGTWAASIVGALAVGWFSNDVYRARAAAAAQDTEGAPPSAAAQPPSLLAQNPISEPGMTVGPSMETGAPAAVAAGTLLGDAVMSSPAAGLGPDVVAATDASGSVGAAGGVSSARDPDGLVVRGFVADEGGRPVPSAHIYVAELEVGVLTQEDGRYDLRLPAEPDSFELTVERIGYRQQARAISGYEGDYVDADFRLREEALALDEIIVTGESDAEPRRPSGNVMTRMRATPFVWRPLPSIAAEGYVGSDLWTLPGLDVLTLEVAYGDNPNETHVARVRQDLGGGIILTLVQGRTDGRRTRWPIQAAGTVQSTWRGEMLITATAPVSADSLRTLLTHLR
jgi:predicted anti-sigma-YlaC factor YlaD